MATVTGYTAEHMKVIEDETVVDGEVQGDNLVLITRAGTQINAGNVRGPTGATGPPATVASPLTLTSTAAAQVPLTLVGSSGQSANLLQIKNSGGTNMFIVDKSGAASIGKDPSFGSGAGPMLFLADDSADPSTDPVGGGILYSSAGVLKHRNPAGVVTTIAPPPPPIRENYNRTAALFGTGNPSWPTKTLAGRVLATTDANGIFTIDLSSVWVEAGISPIPSVILAAFCQAQNGFVNITGYQMQVSASVIYWRAFGTGGGSPGAIQFSASYVIYFQNGAT